MKRLTYDLFIVFLVLVGVACQRHDEMEMEEESDAPLTMGMLGLTDVVSRVTETGAFVKGESVKVTVEKNGVKTSAVYSLVVDGTDSLWQRTALTPLYYVKVKDADSFTVESWGGKAPVDDVVPYLNQRSQENYLKSDYTVGLGTLVSADGVNPMSINNHQLNATLDHQFTDVRVSVKNESSSVINLLCVNLLNKKGSKTLSYGAGLDADEKYRYWGIVSPDSIPDLEEDFVQVGYAFKTKPTDTLYVEARLANTAFDGISDLKGERLNISLVFNNEKLIFETLTLEEWVETEMEGEVTEIVPIIYDEKLDLFKIYLAEGMKIFADIVNGDNKEPVIGWTSTPFPNNILSANGKLVRNVSLMKYMNGTGWVPIGKFGTNSSKKYTGQFDGDHKMIKHLKINSTQTESQGLFGQISDNAHIKNVILVGCDVTGKSKVGCLVGSMTGGTKLDSCRIISNESTVAQATVGTTVEDAVVGLLVGNVSGSVIISDCSVEGGGVVKGLVGTRYKNKVGGLIGYIKGATTVQRCTTDVSVVYGQNEVGGIVGKSEGGASSFNQCVAKTSTVFAAGKDVAGLIGWSGEITVDNCMADTYYIVDKGSLTSTGGLLGYTQAKKVSNCKSVVYKMEGGENVGGLIAHINKNGASITDCDVQIGLYIQGKDKRTGGLVGLLQNGVTIKNCKVKSETGTIKGVTNNSEYTELVGGLIGSSRSSSKIIDCEVDVNTICGGCAVGGLLGGEYTKKDGADPVGSSTISNCKVIVKDIDGNGVDIGGFIGHARAGIKVNQNCSVKISGKIKANIDSNCGGFVGYVNDATTTRSVFTDCTTDVVEVFGNQSVGGFVGTKKGICDFMSCTAKGDVRGKNKYTGGFIGQADTKVNTNLSSNYIKCSHIGNVIGENLLLQKQEGVGGFAGCLGGGQIIEECMVEGNVTGETNVGGFVGMCIVEETETGVTMSKRNEYKGGVVTCTSSSVGGFIGYIRQYKSSASIKMEECDASNAVIVAKRGSVYIEKVGGFAGELGLIGTGNVTISACKPSQNELRGSSLLGGMIGDILVSSNTLVVNNCKDMTPILKADLTSALNEGYYGGFIGRLRCLSSDGVVNIEDCSTKGSLSMVGGNGLYMGGFIGEIKQQTGIVNLKNCEANGAVQSTGGYTGGFVGNLDANNITVNNCTAKGFVSQTSNLLYTGGFAGLINSRGDVKINSCTALGNLERLAKTESGAWVGGFVGYLSTGTSATLEIKECASKGDIMSNEVGTGGFVGRIETKGDNSSILIENSQTAGNEMKSDISEDWGEHEKGGYGGFCGSVLASKGLITMEKCTSSIKEIYAPYLVQVGGFVGNMLNGAMKIKDCQSYVENIRGEQSVGGFVGKISSSSIVTNIDILDCNTTSNVNGNALLGGFVGYVGRAKECSSNVLESTTWSFLGSVLLGRCKSEGTVSATNQGDSRNLYYGGFMGLSNVKSVNGLNIYACCATGNVGNKYENKYSVGGFAGRIGVNSKVVACYSTGDVTTQTLTTEKKSLAGGFVSDVYGVVRSCYSIGDVKLTNTTEPKSSTYYGGFAGSMMNVNNAIVMPEVSYCATTSNIYWGVNLYANQAFCGRSFLIWDHDASPFDSMLPNIEGLAYSIPTNYSNITDASGIYDVVTGISESFTIDGTNYSTDSEVWINNPGGPTLWW